MTNREADEELLAFIRQYIAERHISPCQREMKDHLGHKTFSSVTARLRRLRSQGRIDWIDRSPRTVRILEES